MQHECVPSAAGGLELGQDASSAQLRGPYAAYSKPRGTETTCPGALSLHTRTHASLPPCSLHTSASTHTLPWVKTHSLTFTQTVFSHPEGHTHIQKALSLHRGSKGTTKLSPMLTGQNQRVRREAGRLGRRTLGGREHYTGSGSPGQGHPCLGPLLLPGCPRYTVVRV